MKLIEKGNPSFRAKLFIHGFLGKAEDWDFVVDHLSENHYVVSMDLNENEKTVSPWPDDLASGMTLAKNNFSQWLASIERFGKNRGIKEWDIIGYSLGGRLAALLADPLNVNVLIMESASFGIKEKREREKRFFQDKALYAKVRENWGEVFLRNWYCSPIFKGMMTERTKIEKLIKNRLKLTKEMVLKQLILYGQAFLPRANASSKHLAKRIILLSGEWDVKYASLIKKEAGNNKDIEVIIKANASHNVHFFHPLWFSKWITKIIH